MIQLDTPPQQRHAHAAPASAPYSDGKGSSKRTRSVSPERSAKRPHLYLSRKLSYSSPLRDTPVHPANNVNNAPPSPGFPSVLAVASSLASSLRASSSSCCSSGDASAMEDHPSILPQHPHWDISKPPSPFRLCSAPSGRLSFPPASNRVESLRSSVLTANSGIPSTSKTVLEDFLIPRPPASSRCSSSDSFYNDRCMRDSSEDPSLPSSSTFWPSGLVMPDEDDGDAMEEDTTLEHDLARISGNRTPNHSSDPDTEPPPEPCPYREPPVSTLLSSSPPRPALQRSRSPYRSDTAMTATSMNASPGSHSKEKGTRYSMGIKKGCIKCQRGDKGHFTHIGQ